MTSDGYELLEGTMWFRNKMKSYNKPTSIPYRTMLPPKVDGLLVPVGLSATHVAFTGLRMEPTWMATGQAAGVAAAVAIKDGCAVRSIEMGRYQDNLLEQGQILVYFESPSPGFHDPEPAQNASTISTDEFKDIQKEAVRSNIDGYSLKAIAGK